MRIISEPYKGFNKINLIWRLQRFFAGHSLPHNTSEIAGAAR